MKLVIVNIHVIPGKAEEFIAASLENAANSLKEPGVLRFELLRDEERPDRFALIEGYRDSEAQAAHKETPHYLKWRDLAEPMMAEPRTRAVFQSLGT